MFIVFLIYHVPETVSESMVFSPSTPGVNPPSPFAGSLFLFAQIYYLTVNPRGKINVTNNATGYKCILCFFQFRDPIITNTLNVGYTH